MDDDPKWSWQQFRTEFKESGQRVREWLFARRVCNESLAAYRAVKAADAGLAGDALYEAVIARRTRLDAEGARRLLERAHASREDWDNERPANFRDVVMFMIVTEYLAGARGVQGMSLDLVGFLDRRLPAGL